MFVSSSKMKFNVCSLSDKQEMTSFRPLFKKVKPGGSVAYATAHWFDKNLILASDHLSQLCVYELSKEIRHSFRVVHKLHSREIYNITSHTEPDGSKIIWSTSQDRRVIQFRLDMLKVNTTEPMLQETSVNVPLGDCLLDLQTLGGFVNAIKTCPTDATVVGVALGDGQIRSLSTMDSSGHGSPFWVKFKPFTLAWHPEKEGILAFGSENGKVGYLNTLKRSATFGFSLNLKGNVYCMQWVKWNPDGGAEKHYLWACGGNDIAVYDDDNLDESYTILELPKPLDASNGQTAETRGVCEFCWTDDYKVLATGNNQGFVSIYTISEDTLCNRGTIVAFRQHINSIAWLQYGESNEEGLWLAIASDNKVVKVFCIPSSIISDNVSSLPPSLQPHTVLQGHSEKVCCVAWSPHERGILATASVDSTVRVWNGFDGKELAVYSDPLFSRYFCLEWSHWEEDLIFAGGDKNYLASIRPSQHPPSAYVKPNGKAASDKAKGEKENIEVKKQTETAKEYVKQKNPTVLYPTLVSLENRKKEFQYEDCFALLRATTIGEKSEETSIMFYLFGEDFRVAINREAECSLKAGCTENYLLLSVWSDKPWDEMARALTAANQIDEFLFAVQKGDTPLWKNVVERHVAWLLQNDLFRKATIFWHLLGEKENALETLLAADLSRDAFVYAKLNFPENDERVKNTGRVYANTWMCNNRPELATKVYLSINDFDSALDMIRRKNDPLSSLLASEIAKFSSSKNMSDVYVVQCIHDALSRNDRKTADRAIELNPKFYWCKPVVDIYFFLCVEQKEMSQKETSAVDSQCAPMLPEQLLNECVNLFDGIKKDFMLKWHLKDCSEVTAEIQKTFCASVIPKQQEKMLIHLSGRLAASVLSSESVEDMLTDIKAVYTEYAPSSGDSLPLIFSELSMLSQ
ncbi:hypothetical protein QYM36_000010 [Artemia franciscana]|nr:hypothetical protein QYM36_000010 [Artemia franciscana]